MEIFNKLEVIILATLIEENNIKYPLLKSHLPLLKVKSREFTGVGIYTNFHYITEPLTEEISALLSSPNQLLMDNLENELSYLLDITDGKINYLEILTNGNEAWDGKFESSIYMNSW